MLRGFESRQKVAAAALFFMCLLAATPGRASEPFDLVIRNGRVIDPESGLDAIRDVAVRDGRIVALSEQPLRGRKIIDATGLVVSPGFIDLHAHGQQLPAARMQAFDGVTTALELEGGVLPVSRFYDDIAKEGRPINYGASASWTEAREAAFHPLTAANAQKPEKESDDWLYSLASPEQLRQVADALEQGLKEGALGIGITLAYVPGTGHKEYYAINKLAAARNVPTFTHVRHSSVIEPNSSFEAYQEVLATAVATGARMHICHLNSTSSRDIDLAAELIGQGQHRGLAITVEAYPYPAASTTIGAAFFRGPQWRQRLGDARYEDFELNGEPLDERRFLDLQQNKPDTLIVFHYLRPELNAQDESYLDKSVLYAGGAIASDAVWWTLDGKLIEGNVWPMPKGAYAHPRSAGTFSRFLRVYVRERQKLSLSQAIEKASLIPARILEVSVPQMKHKGRISVGADADLIVFDLQTVSDRATFVTPAQTSIGMQHVIVNGTPVIVNGKLVVSALPGRAIRRTPDNGR